MMHNKKNFITSIKDNLAENIICLLSLIINIFQTVDKMASLC